MPGPNGHVHSFHNEMSQCPVKTKDGAEQVREHRKAVPELLPVEIRDNCRSPVEVVKCMGRINCPPQYSLTH